MVSLAWCQAIIWTNDGILLTGPLGTNFSEILIRIYIFSFKKMHLKLSSAKWRPFCLCVSVFMYIYVKSYHFSRQVLFSTVRQQIRPLCGVRSSQSHSTHHEQRQDHVIRGNHLYSSHSSGKWLSAWSIDWLIDWFLYFLLWKVLKEAFFFIKLALFTEAYTIQNLKIYISIFNINVTKQRGLTLVTCFCIMMTKLMGTIVNHVSSIIVGKSCHESWPKNLFIFF